MNDCVSVTIANGGHLVCVITVAVLFVAAIAAEWREWRTEKELERRTEERDDLAIANGNLLEERGGWKSENMALRYEIADLRAALLPFSSLERYNAATVGDVRQAADALRITDAEQPDGGERR